MLKTATSVSVRYVVTMVNDNYWCYLAALVAAAAG